MQIKKAKQIAASAGLEFYYDRSWRSWGLIDPEMRAEHSEWISPADMRDLTESHLSLMISTMHARIYPDASGPFPIVGAVEDGPPPRPIIIGAIEGI